MTAGTLSVHKRVWFTHATDIVGACAGGDGVFGAESVGYGSMRGSVWYGEISVSTVSGQTPFLEKKKERMRLWEEEKGKKI